MEFLSREESPFNKEVWERIDSIVIKTLKDYLVGRRFINITPVLDVSVMSVPVETVQNGSIKVEKFLPVPELISDFKIDWRRVEGIKRGSIPFDASIFVSAAKELAYKEDKLIFLGDDKSGFPGLLTVENPVTIPAEDFSEEGSIFRVAVSAVKELNQKGFIKDFALVLNPVDYAKGFRLFGNSGNLEIEHVKQIFDVGVFTSNFIPEGSLLVVSSSVENLDIYLVQDAITAYTGYENMEHTFRILELLSLRIKNPKSICIAR